jgi:hypothetical protein
LAQISKNCHHFAPLKKQHRKKITTGLVELAAVMATDKVFRKATKASKVFSNFIEENA